MAQITDAYALLTAFDMAGVEAAHADSNHPQHYLAQTAFMLATEYLRAEKAVAAAAAKLAEEATKIQRATEAGQLHMLFGTAGAGVEVRGAQEVTAASARWNGLREALRALAYNWRHATKG